MLFLRYINTFSKFLFLFLPFFSFSLLRTIEFRILDQRVGFIAEMPSGFLMFVKQSVFFV